MNVTDDMICVCHDENVWHPEDKECVKNVSCTEWDEYLFVANGLEGLRCVGHDKCEDMGLVATERDFKIYGFINVCEC